MYPQETTGILTSEFGDRKEQGDNRFHLASVELFILGTCNQLRFCEVEAVWFFFYPVSLHLYPHFCFLVVAPPPLIIGVSDILQTDF